MASTEAHLRAAKKYQQNNKEKYALWARIYRAKTPEKQKEIRARFMAKNREKCRAECRDYYKRNKDKVKARRKAYNSSPQGRLRINSYMRDQRKNNPEFLVATRARAIVRHAVRVYGNGAKPCSTQILCGCSWIQLCEYLQSKFQPGMNWENIKKWHIDHIVPLCSFDLTESEEVFKAFHYTNLQPLWAQQNWEKGPRRKCEYVQG